MSVYWLARAAKLPHRPPSARDALLRAFGLILLIGSRNTNAANQYHEAGRASDLRVVFDPAHHGGKSYQLVCEGG